MQFTQVQEEETAISAIVKFEGLDFEEEQEFRNYCAITEVNMYSMDDVKQAWRHYEQYIMPTSKDRSIFLQNMPSRYTHEAPIPARVLEVY